MGESLSGTGAFVAGFGPRFPASPQPIADAPMLTAGDAAIFDPAGEGVFLGKIFYRGVEHCGRGVRPCFCHSRQPSTAHWRMPGHSGLSFSNSCWSRSFSGIVTVNGIIWMRRRIASSTLLSEGL